MRTFGFDWVNYHCNNDINFPIFTKIAFTLMCTISMIWVYQIVNMILSKICKAFPWYQILKKIKNQFKKTRKYTLLINLFIGL